jgi:hypothetical protein
VRATLAWCTRVTWRTSYANFARNMCVTYAPDSCRIHVRRASHPRIRRWCCAHLLHEECSTRDVSFGPRLVVILQFLNHQLLSFCNF